jgi:hypothetical protein
MVVEWSLPPSWYCGRRGRERGQPGPVSRDETSEMKGKGAAWSVGQKLQRGRGGGEREGEGEGEREMEMGG